MKNVLLLGGDTRALYGLIRFFSGARLNVFVADCGTRSITATTALARYVYLPTMVVPIEHYRAEDLTRICRENGIDSIIPVTDQAYWRLNNSPIAKDFQSLVIGYDSNTYRALNDKGYVETFATNHFCAPAIVDSVNPDQLYIVKDRSSFQPNQLENRGRVALSYGRDLGDVTDDKLIYEYLEGGSGAGIGLVAKAGNILAISAHRRLYENGLAGSAIRQRIDIPPDVRLRVKRFAAEVGLDGLNMLEFKIINGNWYFIELNPRPWGSLPLYLADPDFAQGLAQAFGIEAAVHKRRQKIQINLIKTIKNQPAALFRLLPHLPFVAFDEINSRENLLFRYLILKLQARMSFFTHKLMAKLSGVDWRQVDGTPNFICFGNINRSALAEAEWRHCGYPATSSGTIERCGRNRSEVLLAYLADNGIVSEGLSSPLDVKVNGPLVIFDRFIYEDLVFRHGIDRRRIFLFCPNEVPDPHGRDQIAYTQVFECISHNLRRG